MDVRHLRTFAMLAEELHFGRTALRLNTSQPVVSRTVKELERDVGVTLVERSARRVSLTRAGRLFLARARTALENIAAGTREARSGFSNDIDSVRLGVLIGTAQPFSGSLLTAFQKAHPLATVSLVTLTERTLATALTERHVDAAIASNDCLPGHLNRLEIGQAEIEIFVGDGHFLSDRTAIAFDDLADVPLVVPSPDAHPMLHDRIRALFRHKGIEPDVAVVADDILQMLCIAAIGAAVALAPAYTGLQIPGLVRRPLSPRFYAPFSLAWMGSSRVTDALCEAAVSASATGQHAGDGPDSG